MRQPTPRGQRRDIEFKWRAGLVFLAFLSRPKIEKWPCLRQNAQCDTRHGKHNGIFAQVACVDLPSGRQPEDAISGRLMGEGPLIVGATILDVPADWVRHVADRGKLGKSAPRLSIAERGSLSPDAERRALNPPKLQTARLPRAPVPQNTRRRMVRTGIPRRA